MITIDEAIARAADHGLHLVPDGARLIDSGLDYAVVMAEDPDGRRWVLRVPRRADVAEEMAAEARVLDLVSPVLAADGVAVPDWRVRSSDLIAYPALPGSPGLTLTEAMEPVWHIDPFTEDYARRLGRLLARLHSVTPEQAAAAGVEVRSPEEVRSAWAADIERVTGEFTVAGELTTAWRQWLADDACWPETTVLTHGEIYPAHLLFDGAGEVTGILDWTTARVDDPARDLSAQFGVAGEEMLRASITAYEEAGGHAHPGLATQARRLWEAAPIGYALFALVTGEPDHHAAAAARLDPDGAGQAGRT
jgi:macrolide phosphotransferase